MWYEYKSNKIAICQQSIKQINNPRICKRRRIFLKILWLFFMEVQPVKRHRESTSTASQLKSQNKQSSSPFTKPWLNQSIYESIKSRRNKNWQIFTHLRLRRGKSFHKSFWTQQQKVYRWDSHWETLGVNMMIESMHQHSQKWVDIDLSTSVLIIYWKQKG